MNSIACADMGIEGCPFVAEGETMEEAMMKSKEHATATHAAEIEKMMADGMTEESMMEKMKSVVKTA